MPIAIARRNRRSVSPSALVGFDSDDNEVPKVMAKTQTRPTASTSRENRTKWRRRLSMPVLCEKSEIKPDPDLLENEEHQAPSLKSCMSVPSLQESLRGHTEKAKDSSKEALRKPHRSVSFHKIEFRQFQRTLGDHPASRGAPVTLSWQFDPSHPTLSIDDYESYRPPRRSRSQIYMSSYHREEMLLNENVSRAAIRKATKEVTKVREQRQKTVETLHNAPVEEAMESAKRRLKKLYNRTSGRKEEEMLWKKASEYKIQEARRSEEIIINNFQMWEVGDAVGVMGEGDDVPLSF